MRGASGELFDERTKVSLEVRLALESYARARGVDKSEVIREILSQWTDFQDRFAKDYLRRLRNEGLSGADEGKAGAP